jgi:large conductance mechanosensitive channel
MSGSSPAFNWISDFTFLRGANMGFVKEFKEFAMRGNVMDMAVGIIIGAAFTTVVNSLVKDVIMPPLGYVTGGLDFADKKLMLRQAVKAADGTTIVKPDVTLNYGLFINAIISFIIVAFAIFLLVKGMNALRRKQEAAPAAPPGPTTDQKLLMEIRDAIRVRG